MYATSGGERDIYRTLSEIAPTVALPKGALPAGEGSIEVPAGRLADYDADVLLVYPFGQTADELCRRAALETLGSARNGRLFVREDLALSNSSVLSIPYALDTLLPEIDRALTAGT